MDGWMNPARSSITLFLGKLKIFKFIRFLKIFILFYFICEEGKTEFFFQIFSGNIVFSKWNLQNYLC